MNEALISQLFILALSVFLGFALISRVPPLLHTPLMSEGALVNGQTPALVLGNVITSRMLDSLAKIVNNLSMPKANPPWGGAPN